ncbi:MAG: spore coat protein H [Verrucomicrobiales bacterium]|jgi:spore coat protein H
MKYLHQLQPLVMTIVVAAAVSLSAIISHAQEAEIETKKETADALFWKSIYEDHRVVEIDITVTAEAWDAMQPTPGEGGAGGRRGESESDFSYAKAEITVDGDQFEDAGLRFKGNSSYRSSSNGFKRPFKIDTNRFVKGQKLHGRTKFNLSNAYLDSAYMKEKLAYELYSAAGIPTPGVGWAAVSLTIEGQLEKKYLGVYALVEQVDSRYLGRKFGKATKGSLLMKPEGSPNWEYPGETAALYEPFDIKVGEDNEDQIRRFGEFLKLVNSGSDTEFASEIGERMDLDQFAGYLAATSLLANIDSYIAMPHNYYLLVDKTDGKVRLLPWDVNEAFGTFTMGSSPEKLVEWDIDRPWLADLKLIKRLFATEKFPALYKATVAKLMASAFTEERLFGRIAVFEKAITPFIARDKVGAGLVGLRMGIDGDSSGYNSAVDRQVFAIKPFVRKRIQSVNGQLAGEIEGVTIEGRGPGGGRRGPGRGRSPGEGRPPRGR